jgi:PE family
MTFVIAAPEMMTAAATELAGICSDLSVAHSAAEKATVALTPAAADEVSAGIAHWFSEHAHGFHALAGTASAMNAQFAHNLKTSAASYTSAEDAIASLLRRNALLTGILAWLEQPLPTPPILEKYPHLLDAYDFLLRTGVFEFLVNFVSGLFALAGVALAVIFFGGLIVLAALGVVIGQLLHGIQG